MAEPNWKPCVHSVQPRLVYRPPAVKTGAPWAGAQDFSMERILAADRANIRRTLGPSALNSGADCVSTISRNSSVSACRGVLNRFGGTMKVRAYRVEQTLVQ